MINFDEEIKKFQPVLNIEDIESQLINDDLNDLIDLVKKYTIDRESAGQATAIREKGL